MMRKLAVLAVSCLVFPAFAQTSDKAQQGEQKTTPEGANVGSGEKTQTATSKKTKKSKKAKKNGKTERMDHSKMDHSKMDHSKMESPGK
jgi:uncharacterized protein involved in copper resistance